MECQEPTCGKEFEPRQPHGRFCSAYCRVKWNRRNARQPAEPSAGSRAAAVDLAHLVGARQAGKITEGQFAAAAVSLIGTRFTSVHEALVALGVLAWEGIDRGLTVADHTERENA
jgi:hypothetical protein